MAWSSTRRPTRRHGRHVGVSVLGAREVRPGASHWSARSGGLPDAAMLRDAELAEGGETRTSWYTEDEPMPLYAFDQRACDRLATLRALEALTEEVRR